MILWTTNEEETPVEKYKRLEDACAETIAERKILNALIQQKNRLEITIADRQTSLQNALTTERNLYNQLFRDGIINTEGEMI